MDTDFTDEDEMEQDPSIRELEKEIESELREAGLNSKRKYIVSRNHKTIIRYFLKKL